MSTIRRWTKLTSLSLATMVVTAGCNTQPLVDAMASQLEGVMNTMFQTVFTKWVYDAMDVPLPTS